MLAGISDPRSVAAGVQFTLLLRDTNFRNHLAEIGAPDECPVVCVFDGMDPRKRQILIDYAFTNLGEENGEAEQILIISVDYSQPFGLRIERRTFENEIQALQREVCCILGNGS